MRVVIDTNILVSALIKDGICREIIMNAIWGKIIPIATYPVYQEYKEQSIAIEERYGPGCRNLYRRFLQSLDIYPPKYIPKVCRDPKDDKFLGAAEQKKVKYIVSNDKDLLILHSYKGIPIYNAEDFIKLLYSEA